MHRKWLIQLIYKDIKDVKGITEEQLSQLSKKHLIIPKIYSTIKDSVK